MVIGIRQIPRVLAKGKSLADLPKRLYSKPAYTNAGQKPRFRCSHTLSFTAAIGATGIAPTGPFERKVHYRPQKNYEGNSP